MSLSVDRRFSAEIPTLQIRFLGQFDVRADGLRLQIPTRAAQSLFALLLLTAGVPHRREKLAGMLWPDVTDENARRSLRQELWRLRKVLRSQSANDSFEHTDEYLVAEELTIAFNAAAPYWFDVAQFEQSVSSDKMLNDLTRPLALYQGELLPGFYDDWVLLERERVEQMFERKMQQLVELLVQQERWTAALEWGERWIVQGHTPEPAYRALMLAHAALGNPSQVTVDYERCRHALQDGLGVEPSEETRRLYEKIARGERVTRVSLSGAQIVRRAPIRSEPPAPGEPPYKGLEFFDEADASIFFGRELLVEKLAQEISANRFLAVVVGASGSGKSSIVRAGLIPALRTTDDGRRTANDEWQIFVMPPTAHPLEALAVTLTRAAESVTATATLLDDLAHEPRALRLFLRRQNTDDGTQTTAHRPPTPNLRHLLVVDQFEELFTRCRDEFEREQFMDHLLDAVQVNAGEGAARTRLVTLVVTLRADFYAHLAQSLELRDAAA